MEAIGDITASAEVSQLPVHGEEFDSRVRGGLLVSTPVRFADALTDDVIQSDGLGGFFSALFTVTPLSVFAQASSRLKSLSECRLTKKLEQRCYFHH